MVNHALCARSKSFLDLRALSLDALVELTLLQCDSKGQEHEASFQVVSVGLGSGEERVLAKADGKLSPLLPLTAH